MRWAGTGAGRPEQLSGNQRQAEAKCMTSRRSITAGRMRGNTDPEGRSKKMSHCRLAQRPNRVKASTVAPAETPRNKMGMEPGLCL